MLYEVITDIVEERFEFVDDLPRFGAEALERQELDREAEFFL